MKKTKNIFFLLNYTFFKIKCYHDIIQNKLCIKLINLAINLLFKFDFQIDDNENNNTNITDTKFTKKLSQIENVYFEFYLFPSSSLSSSSKEKYIKNIFFFIRCYYSL
jgi:hypothetical protein